MNYEQKVGVVEPQPGCDGAGVANIDVALPTAIAASLRLDNCHKGFTSLTGFNP
ncbi:hypothetical protein D3C73_1649420 [compost metagenome]|jgi:hypothetical protein